MRLKSFTGDPLAIAAYGPLVADGRAAPSRSPSVRPAPGDAPGPPRRPGRGRDVPRGRGGAEPRPAVPSPATSCRRRRTRTSSSSPTSIGLARRDGDGEPLGTVVAVPNYGGGDLLEIAPAERRRDRAPALHQGLRAAGRSRGRRVVADAAAPTSSRRQTANRSRPEEPRDLRGHDPHPLSRRCFPGPSGCRCRATRSRAACGRSRPATSAITASAATAPSTTRRPAAGPAW